jgi:nitroreductase
LEKKPNDRWGNVTFKKSVIETMRKRHSVRNFTTQNISKDQIKNIVDYINSEENLIGPFGKRGRIELIQVTNNVTDKGIKLGTYGFIKNPNAFLVGITENDKYSLIDFAYSFHKLVIVLTDLEIGTCWMGGTFNRSSFEQEIVLNSSEFIPCITPIGYSNDKQRVLEKALRLVIKADNRKPWNKLFFESNFTDNLSKENAGMLEIPIEMVRLGPSATNKQPWRLVLSANRKDCHFYIEHTPNYSASLGYDMQLLDIGIAMCQFELACKELCIEGQWELEDPNLDLPNDQTEYVVTWKSR